jgi:hypothetical protein
MATRRCLLICSSAFIVISLLLVIIAAVFPIVIQNKLENGIKNLLVIDSTKAPGYKSWQNDTPEDEVPQYEIFYIFNITNPDAVKNGTEKPNLQEVLRRTIIH